MNLSGVLRADPAERPLCFPAGAFALGAALFSGSFQEALLCGGMVLWAAVLAAFLTGLLRGLPEWSVRASALLAVPSLTAAFALAAGGNSRAALTGGLLGLLAAGDSLADSGWGDRCGLLLARTGLGWALWLLCGAAREFLSGGTVLGRKLADFPMQSSAFSGAAFGFLAAGILLGAVCAAARRGCPAGRFEAAVPAVCLAAAFLLPPEGSLPEGAFRTAAGLVLWLSARRMLVFSRVSPAFRRLPAEMLAAGLILLVLGGY